MKKLQGYEKTLAAVKLFDGITSEERTSMLTCMRAAVKEFGKGEQLLTAGERPESVGIVLSGEVHIVKNDVRGNRTLLAVLRKTDIFAEALCCAGVTESPVTVVAETDTEVLLLRFSEILHTCPKGCSFHGKLIENMLKIVAKKNLYLQNRMELVRIKSLREKVLRYLAPFSEGQGKRFEIPLNREEMADYLCVDRSALSHELMRMKEEGLLEYSRNVFTLMFLPSD